MHACTLAGGNIYLCRQPAGSLHIFGGREHIQPQHKARIGLIVPPRDPQARVVSGSGIVEANTVDDLTGQLSKDARVASVTALSLENAYVKNGKVYDGDQCLSDFDIVFWLYYVGDNPFAWDLLHILSQQTRVIPEPSASYRTRNKYYAHSTLRAAGVPTTDFCVFDAAAAEDIAAGVLKDWGDVLLKPVLGDFGHGISKVSDARTFVDVVGYAQSFSDKPLQIFCEKFERNDLSKWVSVTVIGGKAVFGYRKRDSAFVDGWKVYDAGRIGGNADYVDVSASPTAKIAEAAAAALGCDIVGLDFIYSDVAQGYLIVDENTLPGMYAECFAAAGKGSLADHLARLVLGQLNAKVLAA